MKTFFLLIQKGGTIYLVVGTKWKLTCGEALAHFKIYPTEYDAIKYCTKVSSTNYVENKYRIVEDTILYKLYSASKVKERLYKCI